MPTIAVIGDIMLDTYHTVDMVRPAPEGNFIYTPTHTEYRPGAAANIADCLETLGCDVTLFGHCGHDPDSMKLRSWAMACGIHGHWLDIGNQKIRTNTRYLHNNTCIFRCDSTAPDTSWLSFDLHQLKHFDAVVVYDKGSLCLIADDILSYCHTHGIRTYVDPSRAYHTYPLSYLIKANTLEAGFINPQNICFGEYKKLHQWTHCIITNDMHALDYWDETHTHSSYPIIPEETIVDPIGAGDAFLAAIIAAEHQGIILRDAIPYGIRAGALALKNRGTYAPTRHEIGLS